MTNRYLPDRSAPVVVQTRDVLEALAGLARASGQIKLNELPEDGSTITIYGTTFEFDDDNKITSGRIRVPIEDTIRETRDELMFALTKMREHPDIPLVEAMPFEADTIRLTYWDIGTKGNVPITTNDENIAVSGMHDGRDGIGIAPPTEFSGGQKTISNTPAALVTNPYPCRGVWLGAPVNSTGSAQNAEVVFVGDKNSQTLPIVPDASLGIYIAIDDAQKIYVVGRQNDKINYRIIR